MDNRRRLFLLPKCADWAAPWSRLKLIFENARFVAYFFLWPQSKRPQIVFVARKSDATIVHIHVLVLTVGLCVRYW